MMRMLAALLILCAAPIGADAAPHRAAKAKHAAAPKAKRPTAARQAKSTHAAPRTADEAETPTEHKDPKPEVVHAKGAAVSQADDSEDPPVRQRAK